jgi:hypothetical protein
MTTGANLGRARATAIMTTHDRSVAVLETNAKGGKGMHGTAITIPDGPIAIETIETAIATVARCSHATSASRVDQSGRSFATAIANTPYAAPNRARWRPLERSEWSPVVTFATTTVARLIHAPATCVTCANKG